MNGFYFYFGLALQLFGFTAVGLCFYSGIQSGDYGRIELAQFILGIFCFYVGTFLKNKAA